MDRDPSEENEDRLREVQAEYIATSQPVEWMDATYIGSEVVPAGTGIGGGRVEDGNYALVLSGDYIVVIEGDLTHLARLGGQIMAQVAAAQGRQAEVEVVIPSTAWVPAGDDDEPGGARAILAATVVLNGTRHHAVAYQVTGSDPQTAIQHDGDLDAFNVATGGDGPFATTTIAGHDYAVFTTPFSL